MDWRHLDELLAAGAAVYAELKNLCVWMKNNPRMGSLYRSRHELILVFKHGRGPHRNNVQLGKLGRNRSMYGITRMRKRLVAPAMRATSWPSIPRSNRPHSSRTQSRIAPRAAKSCWTGSWAAALR